MSKEARQYRAFAADRIMITQVTRSLKDDEAQMVLASRKTAAQRAEYTTKETE